MATIDKLFAYTCINCGGHLVLNEDKTIFSCNSCGNKYDYNYFLSDELLKKAKTALNRKEYKSASDMYEFMLRKDSSNFEALVGKLLSEANIKSINAITSECFCEMPLISNINDYINNATEDKRSFFLYFRECIEIAVNINKRRKQMETHKKEISSYNKQISDLEYKEYSYYIGSTQNGSSAPQHPKSFVISMECVLGGFMFLIFLFALSSTNYIPMIIAAIFLIPMFLIFIVNKNAIDAVNRIESEIKVIKTSRDKDEVKYKELDFCNKQDLNRITSNIQEMKKYIK